MAQHSHFSVKGLYRAVEMRFHKSIFLKQKLPILGSNPTFSKKPRNQAIKSVFIGVIALEMAFAFTLVSYPQNARASVFSFVSSLFSGDSSQNEAVPLNSQNMPLLQATLASKSSTAKGGGDITIVGGTSLLPESGPSGTGSDIEDHASPSEISIYVVREGDTLGSIAKMFNVSVNTIAWANDIKRSIIAPGQTLVILPISGIQYEVKKGDTLKSVAKKYKADINEVLQFNNLSEDSVLAIGDTVIIPDAEPDVTGHVTTSAGVKKTKVHGTGGPNYEGYYIRPINGGYRSQGLHGYNGVDLATPVGAPVFASAGGTVIISKTYGWNGGYGQYIVIQHPNNTQTLYGHLSGNFVVVGDNVSRGQVIGLSGNTGNSTGPHIHFEVRGAQNPFGK